ncbi:MAG TPA: glyoxalase [Paenibacillaceae bacterium]|nr:glyoxalase [Paenibacillaceae bacterium]
MPRVVHFELGAKQPEKAVEFYCRVFGWEVQKWDGAEPYWLITTGLNSEPGINGGIMEAGPNRSGTINTINVPSVDDYIEKIINYGGKVIAPKMAIDQVGYLAYCEDTEGNLFGIMEMDQDAQ